MRRIFFTLSLFICIYSHSQNKQALLKSDSLFAKGVELYNQKDYKAAIPLFTESDKIDKAELDSTSNRREYSAMYRREPERISIRNFATMPMHF